MDGANVRTPLVNSEPSLGDAEFVWEKNLSSSVGYSLHSPCLSALSHDDEDRGHCQQLPTTEKKAALADWVFVIAICTSHGYLISFLCSLAK